MVAYACRIHSLFAIIVLLSANLPFIAGCSSSKATSTEGDSGQRDARATGPDDAGVRADSTRDGHDDTGEVGQDGAVEAGVGATVPFTTYEAESMKSNVSPIEMPATRPPSPLPSPLDEGTVENLAAIEASGRAFVALKKTNDYVELQATAAANRFVVRFSVPDAPSGGGITTQLGLYVNGVRQDLSLSSAHAWLYGPLYQNGQSNDPSDGPPHRFWDEAQAVIPNVAPGDTVRLQRDAQDTAAFYWIDLVDLETATPTKMPANSVLVSTCPGALQAADGDAGTYTIEVDAMTTCLNDAAKQGKNVFFPEGRYLQTAKIDIPADGGVVGAGMWFTTFFSSSPVTDFGGPFGFSLSEANGTVSDLRIDCTVDSRSNAGSGITAGANSNFTVERVWVEHTGTGMWVGPVTNTVVRDSRFRDTYADGVNVNSGSSYVTVENNSFRNTGDDGIAAYSSTPASAPNTFVTVSHNTVVQPWSAHGLAIYGGSSLVFENNLVMDPAFYAGIIAGVFPPPKGVTTSFPLSGAKVSGNSLVRAGGWVEGAALYVNVRVNTLSGVSFDNNEISDSLVAGALIAQGPTTTTWSGNTITHPAATGLMIASGAMGSASFNGDQIVGAGGTAYVDDADAAAFKVTKTGTNF